MDYLPWLLIGLCVLGALLSLLLMFLPTLMQPRAGKGNHVAEVWLEWSLGRGSTVYRQRFATQKQAYIYVRIYAWVLDCMLPSHFSSSGRDGGRIRVSNDMSIQYGVRQVTDTEQEDFRTIWSPSMPGTPSFTGEHADFHPLVVADRQTCSTEPGLQL